MATFRLARKPLERSWIIASSRPPGNSTFLVGPPNLGDKLFGGQRSTARFSLSCLLLDVSQHLFPLDRVVGVTHDRQHLKRCQGVNCPVLRAKVEARHSWLGVLSAEDQARSRLPRAMASEVNRLRVKRGTSLVPGSKGRQVRDWHSRLHASTKCHRPLRAKCQRHSRGKVGRTQWPRIH